VSSCVGRRKEGGSARKRRGGRTPASLNQSLTSRPRFLHFLTSPLVDVRTAESVGADGREVGVVLDEWIRAAWSERGVSGIEVKMRGRTNNPLPIRAETRLIFL
jgi:hypothetical protein